jgi:polyhydroxybutyrate depolymerase
VILRLAAAFLLALALPATGCGPDSDCMVGDRSYRIALPSDPDIAPRGALIFAHGYRGSAAGAMRNGSLRRMAFDEGFAFLALQGVRGTWDLPFGPGTRSSTGAAEFAYVDAVLADAQARFGIDPAQSVLSGFSAGAMLTWTLACSHTGGIPAFISVSGTFWQRPPDTCVNPAVSIVHLHGDADRTVPLDGRPIGDTQQGKVTDALSFYAAFGGFGDMREVSEGDLTCRQRRNAEGAILDFCLFPGGHSLRTEHLHFALERLQTVGRP